VILLEHLSVYSFVQVQVVVLYAVLF